MSNAPVTPEPKFFEHPRYADFLKSLGHTVGDFNLFYSETEKKRTFQQWLEEQEALEDFRNLIPMHIRMTAEEFAWFKAKIDADEEAHIPNLRALSAHPPKGAI